MTFTNEQIQNGQTVIATVRALGLPPQQTADAELDAIAAGLDESGLKNDNYGDIMPDGQMSTSRGVFQQISAWGPLSTRENVAASTRMFLTGGQQGQPGLLDIKGWDSMQPQTAIQAVQQSEFTDGSNYAQQMPLARQFIAQYGASAGTVAGSGVAAGADASTSTDPVPYGGLEPSGAQQLAGAAASSAWSSIEPFLVTGGFVAAGLGLVLMGVWRAAAPARQHVEQAAAAAAI